MKPIDIALLSCNRSRLTEIVIREVKRRTTTPHRLIVLDNGSVDGSPEILSELTEEGLIDLLMCHDENFGVHWGHNRLLSMVRSDLFVSMDNDIVPANTAALGQQDWLQDLIDLMDRFPEFAAISCRPHILIGEPADRFDGYTDIRPMGHIGAHGRMMRTAAVRATGGWKKTRDPKRNNEERTICGKLRKAGHQVAYAVDVRCIHLFGDVNLGEDDWGYPIKGENEHDGEWHGHRKIWPPVTSFSWDRRGIDWELCQ